MPEANQTTSLGEAIAALLRRVPDLWEPVPEGNLEALARLTAAGFIERRITFTIKLPGGDKTQRITIELTGEHGLVEAMTGVVQDLWARCGERWRELRAEIGEPIKPIVAVERDEWRTTDQGRLARDDLERDANVPIDFALKRGFFNSREPVRGQGRLACIENAASGPLAVDLAKCSAAPEIAQALAVAFAEQLKAKQTAENPASTSVNAEAGQGGSVGLSGFLGGEALADALGVHPSRRDAFFKRLERERKNLGDDNWQEIVDRRANTPRYQYRLDSPKLRELANDYKSPKPD
jgi:hypothetical protein